MASAKVQKVMTQPINLIFRFLQNVRKQPLHRSEPLPRCNHHACASPPPAHGSALTPARNPRRQPLSICVSCVPSFHTKLCARRLPPLYLSPHDFHLS